MEIQPFRGPGEHPNILTTSVPPPEAQSLRHIIRTRFANGMPEDSMAIVLREILMGLHFLHECFGTSHNNINSGQIHVRTDQVQTSIKIVLDPGKNFVHPGPAYSQNRTPTDGIWGAGTIALELAYGSLPRNCASREHLVSLANNLIRILQLKFTNVDDQKGKGKEIKKPMIKMPELEKLLDNRSVEDLEKKLHKEKKDREKKNAMAVLQQKCKKAVKFFKKDDGERQFSRDFLEVVRMCLVENPVPANHILAHPFFREPSTGVVQQFERRMR